MHVEYAQLPPPEDSADRIFVTENAVIVLDGATAFVPIPVSGQRYAEHLGEALVEQVKLAEEIDLRDALAGAIRVTCARLGLTAGRSPSSTVAILRRRGEVFDVLVLGDSAVICGTNDAQRFFCDQRLGQLDLSERKRYRSRLQAGCGFDDDHRRALRALQRAQAPFRNSPGGYWIAETDPAAAYQSLTTEIPSESLEWAVLATDGAFGLRDQNFIADWADVARDDQQRLMERLWQLQTWERLEDPRGTRRLRAKLHDDKALAVYRRTSETSGGNYV